MLLYSLGSAGCVYISCGDLGCARVVLLRPVALRKLVSLWGYCCIPDLHEHGVLVRRETVGIIYGNGMGDNLILLRVHALVEPWPSMSSSACWFSV